MVFAVAAFFPGLALGSFLNVVAVRVPVRRSVVRPGSACMSCGEGIAWHDNLPLVSYLLLRGRCRSCSAPISIAYPLVELATAVLVTGCVLAFGLTVEAAIASFFCAVLVAVTLTDLGHRIVPNRIVLPATVVVLAAQTARTLSPEWTIAALAASGFLLVAVLAHPAGMGMGDVKLALLMGAALGRTVGVGLMVGMVAALLPGLVLVARHGRKARKMKIPFAPFLAFGSVVALFAGHALLDAYLAHF